MFDSILSLSGAQVSMQDMLICTAVSIVLGIGVACLYMYRNVYRKSFVISLTLLPAIIEVIIMIVNGNLGTGVAVMGAFSLVRFRSVAGGAREIASIFLAMAIGLASGMGYILYAIVFFVMIGSLNLLLYRIPFGEQKFLEKELKVTIPETLDYDGIFDDLFQKYTQSNMLLKVKTTNMGSLYELHYHISMRKNVVEKEFIDELRCRNGNLNIVCGRVPIQNDEL